jgi:hypothetical protein
MRLQIDSCIARVCSVCGAKLSDIIGESLAVKVAGQLDLYTAQERRSK